MQVSTDMASYSTYQNLSNTKAQTQVSMLKKSMQLTEQLVQELIQKNLQTQQMQTPPKNPQGTISIYA